MAAIRWTNEQWDSFLRKRTTHGATQEAGSTKPAPAQSPAQSPARAATTKPAKPAKPSASGKARAPGKAATPAKSAHHDDEAPRVFMDGPVAAELRAALDQAMISPKQSRYFCRHPDWRGQEYVHQVLFFKALDAWAEKGGGRPALAEDIIGTPNGGLRQHGEAGRMRHAGARRGVPDIEVWIPRTNIFGRTLHGLVIEMKRPKRLHPGTSRVASAAGRPSAEQSARLDRLRARGYRAEIAYGVEEALAILGEYLDGSTRAMELATVPAIWLPSPSTHSPARNFHDHDQKPGSQEPDYVQRG